MNTNTNKPITIETIKRNNKAAGLFYFEPGAMRFFRSRVSSAVFPVAHSFDVLFVTSEKGPTFPRAYTVRRYCGVTHRCETAPGCEFQEFRTLAQAKARAAYLAANGYGDQS